MVDDWRVDDEARQEVENRLETLREKMFGFEELQVKRF